MEDKEYKVKLNITIDRDIKELLQQEANAEKYKDKLFL